MDLQKIKSFIELAKEAGVEKLEYENSGEKLSVTLSGGLRSNYMPMPSPVQTMAGATPAVSGKAKVASGLHEVKSPFVGTFYSSPSPSEPHYVKVGDHIRKGQVLCILEAMKIMNEIESDVSGEVVEMCVENEGLVEYNQVLFLIRTN